MRILFLDGPAGVAGDMFTAALLDAGASWDAVRGAVASLLLPEVEVFAKKTRRGGLSATKFDVLDRTSGRPVEEVGKRPHVTPSELFAVVEAAGLPSAVRGHALAVLRRLAEAEAKVHGLALERVHFHEMGAEDTLVDVVAGCAAWCDLAPGRTVCAPLAVGGGIVRCEHGPLPVPAPATLELLRGMPLFAGEVLAEMTTPTGAALLSHFADAYGPLPAMTVDAVGYGAGSREFPQVPNVFRAVVGHAPEDPSR